MIKLKEIKDSVLHLLFPHVCTGCGSDILNEETVYVCDVLMLCRKQILNCILITR